METTVKMEVSTTAAEQPEKQAQARDTQIT